MNRQPSAENLQDATPAPRSVEKRSAKPRSRAKPVETNEGSAKRTCIMVLGMHRSGTSALTRVLSLLGAALPKNMLGANPTNPAGHWESQPLIMLHDELLASAGSRWDDWRAFNGRWHDTPVAAQFKARANQLLDAEFGDVPLFVFKDPRNCRLSHFWLEIFAERDIAPRVVLPIRSPLEVAQSHRARDGFPLRKGLLLWLRHVLDAEAASRNLPRIVIEYDAFLKDWQSAVAAMERTLGAFPANTDLAAAEIDLFLRDDLKHEHVAPDELARNALVHGWVEQAYTAMRELARNPGSNIARVALDRIGTQFDEASALFGGVLADAEASLTNVEQGLREAEQARQGALAQLSAAQQESLTQAAEVERLAAVIAEVDQAREQALAQLAATRHEREHALSQLIAAQRDSGTHVAEVERLTAMIAEANREREAALAQLEAMRQVRGAQSVKARAEMTEFQQQINVLEQMRQQAQEQAAAAGQARLRELELSFISQIENIERERDDYRAKVTLLISELSDQKRNVDELLNSNSWNLTKPLRAGKIATQKIGRYLFQAAYRAYKRLPLPFRVRERLSRQFRPLLFGFSQSKRSSNNPGIISSILNNRNEKYLQEPLALQEDRFFLKIFRKIKDHVLIHGRLSHIYSVPFLARGGSELVLSHYIRYLNLTIGGSIVVLVTDRMLADASWDLPDNVLVIDLFDFFPSSSREQRSRIIYRIISAMNCDIFHIVNSDASWALLRDYGERLEKVCRVYASCFCLQFDRMTGRRVGYAEYYIADCLPFLSGILTDNIRFSNDVIQLYMNGKDYRQKIYPIYNPVRAFDAEFSNGTGSTVGSLSVLWAGRMDEQKRVDLLLAVAQHVRDVHFHVFGKAVVDDDDGIVERLEKLDNVTLHGGFSQLSELMVAGPYSAFISTSKYEGMPNMLLEIGLVGIPIIAPAVGGIPELIYDQTGYLLPADPTPEDYSAALVAIAKVPDEAARRAACLQTLLADRHCWSSFVKAMSEIDGYLP